MAKSRKTKRRRAEKGRGSREPSKRAREELLMASADLPPSLREALLKRRLLIFSGAGLSMLPPSSLPDWYGFNEAILEEAKASALSTSLSADGIAAIENLDFQSFPYRHFQI
jgi:hypothetical protein